MKKLFLVISTSFLIIISILFFLTIISFTKFLQNQGLDNTALNNYLDNFSTDTTSDPKIKLTTVVGGLNNPWDISFVNKDFFYYSQRIGQLRGHNLSTGEDFLLIEPGANVANEGGLLGLAVDNDFTSNHYIYSCMNILSNGGKKIILSRYQVSKDLKQISDSKIIVPDIPSSDSQRHSGCRVAVSQKGEVWVGTGDTANGPTPQDPKSLGGKVLRIDKDGNGINGNLTEPFDNRIFSYGHRNVQGIVLFNEPIDGVYGYTAEHGPDKDDEVNLLKSGNFGWDPIGTGYNEGVPMTDLVKFPEAIKEIWSSGNPTNAISGMTIVKGGQWKSWNGAVLVAVLKDQHIRLQKYGQNWELDRDEVLFKKQYGRIRTVTQSPSGNLYFTTDNGGSSDVIVEITTE